jgi:hypothetical protein
MSIGALVLISGCGQAPGHRANGFDQAAKLKVMTDVTNAVRAFFAGMATATCDNVEPVARFAKDGTVYVLEDEVVSLSLADYEEGVKSLTCGWTKQEGSVDSVVVTPLAPDAATSAWTYHETRTQKDGAIIRSKGAVLQTWINDGESWKIAATKSSERKLAAE